MFVINHRKYFFAISAFLALASIALVSFLGLNFGIDFTGGSIMEVRYEERPEFEAVEADIKDFTEEFGIGSFSLQAIGEQSYVARTPYLSEEERAKLFTTFESSGEGTVVEERFNSVGPIIGEELQTRAVVAIAIVVLVIVLFVAYVFRQVSEPVSSWRYGLAAIVALVHDIIIPVGIFSVLGVIMGIEIDVLFVTALLAILGFSVNDTIVVFDRIRENLKLNKENSVLEPFEKTVGASLSQVYTRSINTSLTTAFVLASLYFLGGEVTQSFALVLLIGVIIGTYSSIFLASSLLVEIEQRQQSKAQKNTG